MYLKRTGDREGRSQVVLLRQLLSKCSVGRVVAQTST